HLPAAPRCLQACADGAAQQHHQDAPVRRHGSSPYADRGAEVERMLTPPTATVLWSARMTEPSLVAVFGRPWVSLLAAVLIGWLATLYFGRRVAEIPLRRLALGTLLLTITAVAGARIHYILAGSFSADLGARLGDSGMHAGGGVIGLLLGLVVMRRLTGMSPA